MHTAANASEPAPAKAEHLRIAVVSETYPPEVNGVARTLWNLAADLTRQGDTVLLLLPSHPAGRNGTPVAPVTVCVPSVALPLYPDVRLALPFPGSVRRTLEGFRPDIVHIATEGPLGLAALRAARDLGLPCLSSFHTNFPQYLHAYHAGVLSEAAWGYLRRFHNRTGATLCPSASMHAALVERGFLRVTVWGRGVDTVLFSPLWRSDRRREDLGAGPADIVLLYVGRLAPEKNLGALLQVFRQLRRSGLPVKLWLVGDGPLRKALQREAGDGVAFTGFRHGQDLAERYAAADLFVFPSLTETFGNVLQEAMASGLAVAAFRAPGPADIVVHGVTGLLADAGSPEALAQACTDLVTDRSLRARLGRAARAAMQERTWASCTATVRELYRTLCRPPAPAETAPLPRLPAGGSA